MSGRNSAYRLSVGLALVVGAGVLLVLGVGFFRGTAVRPPLWESALWLGLLASTAGLSLHLRRNELRQSAPRSAMTIPGIIPEILVDGLDAAADTTTEATAAVLLSAKGNWRLQVCAQSDIGQVRANNEDSFGVFPHSDSSNGCLLVVADGLGGANAGEVASHIAVQTVRDAYFGNDEAGTDETALRDAISLANSVIFSQAAEDHRLTGMGTTIVAASIVGRALIVGHVGDSRAYLATQDGIKALTRDHNLAEELVHAIGEAPAGSQHILTRSLGNVGEIEVDVSQAIQLRDGDCLLLCSDGLTGVVEPDEMLQAIQAGSPQEACAQLIALANSRGGPDNITVSIARVTAR